MKRLLPLALILLNPMAARASTAQPGVRHAVQSTAVTKVFTAVQHRDRLGFARALRSLTGLHTPMRRMSTGMNRRERDRGQAMMPHSVNAAPLNATGADLALPQSVLDAGNGTQGLVGSGQGPFSVLHSSWSGYQSGVAAEFNFEPIMDLFYQGSVFSGASFARAYMAQSYNHLTSGNPVPPTDCSSSINYPCEIIGYETVTNQIAVYEVAQINYCTIETGYQGDPDLVEQNLDDVSKVAADTFVLGVDEATSACTGASPNPQPTARPTTAPPPTPRPTTAPPPTPRPTTALPPTAVPTQIPSTGNNTTALIFKAKGAGSHTTRAFLAPSNWRVDWWYNCSSTGKNGHYSLTAKSDRGTLSPHLNRSGREGHGSMQFQHSGQIVLAIKTGCHWHLRVYRMT